MKWAARALGSFGCSRPARASCTRSTWSTSPVVAFDTIDGEPWAVPDTLLGTDSHTPMINALGVLGWGVGGLEAEGAMFGLPLALRLPEVVGVRLTGSLRPGCARHRRGAHRDAAPARARGWSASSSSSSGRVCRASAWASAGRSPTWRRVWGHGASSPRTVRSSTISAPPVATRAAAGHRGLRPPLGLLARSGRDAALRGRDRDRSRRVELSLAGPRRPQDRLEPARTAFAMRGPTDAEDDLISDVGRDARPDTDARISRSSRSPRRRGRHRRDHELHQHQRP